MKAKENKRQIRRCSGECDARRRSEKKGCKNTNYSLNSIMFIFPNMLLSYRTEVCFWLWKLRLPVRLQDVHYGTTETNSPRSSSVLLKFGVCTCFRVQVRTVLLLFRGHLIWSSQLCIFLGLQHLCWVTTDSRFLTRVNVRQTTTTTTTIYS